MTKHIFFETWQHSVPAFFAQTRWHRRLSGEHGGKEWRSGQSSQARASQQAMVRSFRGVIGSFSRLIQVKNIQSRLVTLACLGKFNLSPRIELPYWIFKT